jgi:hypothetical protein
MSRKNILKYTIAENHPTDVAFDSRSNPTNVDYLDNVGIFIYSPQAFNGTFTVWASNDKAENNESRLPENWFSLDFGEPVTTNQFTAMVININQVPFSYLAISYTPDAGPFVPSIFTIKLTSKMIG